MSAALNPAQQEAVEHTGGPLLVVAGAGSGKTRVLTTRIARLIEHHRVPPSAILAVTFTNKAAGEMRERIGRLLGHDPAGMWIGTFHGIGARMLRRHADVVGRTPEYTIYDEDDTLAVVKREMERLRISHKVFTPKAILAEISSAKNALVDPVEYERLGRTPIAEASAIGVRPRRSYSTGSTRAFLAEEISARIAFGVKTLWLMRRRSISRFTTARVSSSS